MKIKNSLLFVSIIVFGLLSGCNLDQEKEGECVSNKIEFVTSVNSPSTGSVNETINIEVSFRVFNGCGGFGKFIETQNNNIKNIQIEAKYEGCICTDDIPIRTTNYKFIPTRTGNYKLNFRSSPTEFITIDLVII
jgi:hypothetical protein